MTEKDDFEQAWLEKFRAGLCEYCGGDISQQVMSGSGALTSNSSRSEVIFWTKGAVDRMEALADVRKQRDVMTACACRYPKDGLVDVRARFAETGDINLALQMLQDRFVNFLRTAVKLDEKLIEDIVTRGWGLAGVRNGNKIIATKIPKSGYLKAYFQETDPIRKRQHYCHCPRIRDVLGTTETISPTYCYCGAGFYKGIWEEILQQEIEVELLESVLNGDDVCCVAITIPDQFIK